MVKIKVHVNHRPIGWLRQLAGEMVVTPSLARGTQFDPETVGSAMANFVGPDRESEKKTVPVVTFQVCKV